MQRFLDANNKAVKAHDSGRSIVRTTYDRTNLEVFERSYDEFDQPVDRIDEHWSTKQWLYDSNGQFVKMVFRDKAGRDILPPKAD